MASSLGQIMGLLRLFAGFFIVLWIVSRVRRAISSFARATADASRPASGTPPHTEGPGPTADADSPDARELSEQPIDEADYEELS